MECGLRIIRRVGVDAVKFWVEIKITSFGERLTVVIFGFFTFFGKSTVEIQRFGWYII